MDSDGMIEKLRAVAALNPPLGYRLCFDLGDEGAIWWDGREAPAVIGREPLEEVDTTLRLSPENAGKLIQGELDPTLAYMMGKLKVEGSMGVALKVAAFFEA